MGVQLDPPDRAKLETELREIQRADADELARREVAAAQRRAEWEADRAAEELGRFELLGADFLTIGAHIGERMAQVPRGYITWLLDTRAEFEVGSLMRAMAERAKFLYSHRALPKASGKIIGEPGQRVQVKATVVRTSSFERPRFNASWLSETVQVTTLIDNATGASLVIFSPTFRPQADSELTLKATVKGHGEFRGIAQTTLQRPKEIA
jgi:hypothetical protein